MQNADERPEKSFSLSDISIKNPVFAVMLAAAMIVFGLLGYRDLGISQFPELDFPVVNITTYRDAASPETMDFDVTDIVEDAVSSVEGIESIQSQSLEGVSVVTVYFHLHRDVDVAMQDVQNAVAASAYRLPDDIDPPIVSKVNFNKFPVMWLSVHGGQPVQVLNQFVDDHLKHQVQTIPGVGGVMYGGHRPRNMRIWLDKDKLTAHELDAYDVWRAVRDQHVERPAGFLQSEQREMNVRTLGEARTAKEFAAMPIVSRDKKVITVGDVANVEDGLTDKRTFARFNRRTNVGVGVMRANGANVVQVCDSVKEKLPELKRNLPPDVEIGISVDYSMFIRDDIEEVQNALLLGICLTALVTFVFLGSLGTTMNVCVSIPTSLIGAFMAMKWCGFTINFMTLLALSLSVGVVVDDAILVLENIYRRLENGESRREAALKGARQISFAALAATLSIVAIFVPVAFMKGSIGQFFFQFGITVTVAVMLSLVISLTITPVLSAAFLSVRRMRRPRPPAFGGALGLPLTYARWLIWFLDRWILEPLILRPVDWIMHYSSKMYGRVLSWSMRHRGVVVIAGLLIAASAAIFAFGVEVPLPGLVQKQLGQRALSVKPIGRELVPSEDQNRFVVTIICPVGSNYDYANDMIRKGELILTQLRDPVTGNDVVATFFAAISIRPGSLISEGIMFVRLAPPFDKDGNRVRTLTQNEIMNEVRKGFATTPGVRVITQDLSTQGFTSRRGFPVNFAVQGPDWETVTALSERIHERMIDSGVVADVNSDYRPGMTELQIVPDKVKAAELGVSMRRLGFVINVGVGGMRNGRFSSETRRYDVRMRLLEDQRDSPDDLDHIYVKSDTTGRLVPLRDLSQRRLVSTLPVINRLNHLRKVELSANPAPGVAQGEAVTRSLEIAEEVRQEMGLPPSYRFVMLGNARAMEQTLDSLWYCLALGFIVAAMILGAQFNSFIHPFTVLMAVPFGVTGALATLYFSGDTLNMMSMIGMILLAGLVKKNSIILVDYINHLRRDGMPLIEAVLTAGPVRLRPIVMTTFATVAGAIPLAIGVGAGAETRAPLARSIIGGSILSTIITLVIVPVLYVLFEQAAEWVRNAAKGEESVEKQHQALPAFSVNGESNGVHHPVVETPPAEAKRT